jgi:hypothetical protein
MTKPVKLRTCGSVVQNLARPIRGRREVLTKDEQREILADAWSRTAAMPTPKQGRRKS